MEGAHRTWDGETEMRNLTGSSREPRKHYSRERENQTNQLSEQRGGKKIDICRVFDTFLRRSTIFRYALVAVVQIGKFSCATDVGFVFRHEFS